LNFVEPAALCYQAVKVNLVYSFLGLEVEYLVKEIFLTIHEFNNRKALRVILESLEALILRYF
jgi:hypothetical protein